MQDNKLESIKDEEGFCESDNSELGYGTAEEEMKEILVKD